MSESSEVKALEKISTEVGDSQIKITLSSQCIKAQAFLLDKLRKQGDRQKEICNFISNSNFKLQTEIKQAELEIKSLLIAFDTIKAGNVELKKECLLVRERRSEIEERISNGERKYEDMWMQAKKRYESIPYVQRLLDTTNKTQSLQECISSLENQSQTLMSEIETKRKYFIEIDKRRIIEMAQYLVVDLPNGVKILQEKSQSIQEISKEIDELIKEQQNIVNNSYIEAPLAEKQKTIDIKTASKIEDGWLNISENIERDAMMIPQIHLMNADFDVLNAKLDKIKIKKVEIQSIIPAKRVDGEEPDVQIFSKRAKKDDESSVFFNQPAVGKNNDDMNMKKYNYSNRKLINILEDIKLDKREVYNIVSKVNPNKLQGVDKIGISDSLNDNLEVRSEKNDNVIEEVDLTKTNRDNVLIPPTQFLDFRDNIFGGSQQQVEVIVHMSMTEPTSANSDQPLMNSQESKKRVSFDLPISIQDVNSEMSDDVQKSNKKQEDEANETINSQVNLSFVSDESYTKIKDMILKKHNLDLSPQFVYAKNNINQKDNEKIVTSKFFQTNKSVHDNVKETKMTEIIESRVNSTNGLTEKKEDVQQTQETGINMDIDEVVVSSPKPIQPQQTEKSVAGLLFNHGAQGIPDSLNVSISTTGFEEGDADYPQCIDSSLLLSPKADIPLQTSGDNVEVLSQEVPNFLSGLRKTGFSFFGQTSESKLDTSGQNQGNFNFNFGGDDKKFRGGLFNMFR